MDDWFPVAESMPITLGEAWQGVGKPETECDISRFAIGAEWHKLKQGQKSTKYLSLVKPSLYAPSPTITKGVGTTASLASVVHPLECRKYSRHEAKRAASFPDSFTLAGEWGECLERIGNSVPPLFMRSIARNIKSMLQAGQPIRQSSKLSKVDDYPAFLDACWQEHLAPRAADAPTVVSTFAGAGGSSLGYSMAGFRELLAVEWDDNAVATFKLNFPDVPVYHGDIAKLSVEDVLQRTGLQPGELDVFDGSPPCQGFSTAGKRDFYDDRNQLFREYVRLLRGLQPKVLIMENVSGMVKGKMKLVFADILRELKVSGYRVSARLLNAMYFNVPQSRERMIFVGVREDLGIEPSHPKAVNVPVTVGAALTNCPKTNGRPISARAASIWGRIPVGENGTSVSGPNKDFSLHKVSPSLPCPTIRKGQTAGNGLMHWTEQRYLTDAEQSRLGSFPDGFKWAGDSQAVTNRIGNSVPPLFMRSVALHVRREILSKTPVLAA